MGAVGGDVDDCGGVVMVVCVCVCVVGVMAAVMAAVRIVYLMQKKKLDGNMYNNNELIAHHHGRDGYL